jgi:hypothetical protein
MTSIQEITEIVREEVLGPLKANFNRDQANEQLQIARTTDNLGVQTLALLKVVNRFPNVTDPQIKSELIKFSDALRLAKAVNKSFSSRADKDNELNVNKMYDKAVAAFTSKLL